MDIGLYEDDLDDLIEKPINRVKVKLNRQNKPFIFKFFQRVQKSLEAI